MARYVTDDAVLVIDDRIEYVKCQPGDPRGKIRCLIKNGNTKMTKTITWDGMNNTEVGALYAMQCFINEQGSSK